MHTCSLGGYFDARNNNNSSFKKTAEALVQLKEKLTAESLDEAIQSLVKKQRNTILEKAFSIDSTRISSFSEEDRGEDRN